ncbi:hypothetical protein MXMO3_03605 (plasmid) [Maritalea myrionectae]|uniref:Uncharacterized protein n=2 Tax=Maritalea myrionectae TaxID=454601 RepID=A0A2R4MJH0_9HYPH|nr:hypothetical protein MXMO3_03605 [Maritalea myrionectae]
MRQNRCFLQAMIIILIVALIPIAASAQLDGHGPDAWRVTGVAANDVLNARMGPGVDYPIIETFAHNERGLEQITCVPFFTMAHYQAMTEEELNRLPSRWCLMRSADMSKAGWVAQRFLMEDFPDESMAPATSETGLMPQGQVVDHAKDLVRELYERDFLAGLGGPDPLNPAMLTQYFSTEFAHALISRPPGASVLYGAQDFDGSVDEPVADPDTPILRGTTILHVDMMSFGRPQRATFLLRPDAAQAGNPLRIIRVEHEGWSFP